jgi:hypothetical protein
LNDRSSDAVQSWFSFSLLFQPIDRVRSFQTSLSLRMIGRTLLTEPRCTLLPEMTGLTRARLVASYALPPSFSGIWMPTLRVLRSYCE